MFCHNDLGAEHMLVDVKTNTVTGVIDWTDAAVSDPARDLALVYRDLGPAVFELTLAYYGKPFDDADRERALFYARCKLIADSQVARRTGLTGEQLLALPRYRESGLFDEVEKLVLDYAVGMSRTPMEVSDELFDRLKERSDDAQIAELTHAIALEHLRGRFSLALGVGAAGFSEGTVGALPTTVAKSAPRGAAAG